MPPFTHSTASACRPGTAPPDADALGSNRRDLQLIEAALERIAGARVRLEQGESAAKNRLLHSAVELVSELRRGLDLSRGGPIAANLDDLYDYVSRRLSRAMLQNRRGLLDEATDLLRQIRSAWMILQPCLRKERPATPLPATGTEAPAK